MYGCQKTMKLPSNMLRLLFLSYFYSEVTASCPIAPSMRYHRIEDRRGNSKSWKHKHDKHDFSALAILLNPFAPSATALQLSIISLLSPHCISSPLQQHQKRRQGIGGREATSGRLIKYLLPSFQPPTIKAALVRCSSPLLFSFHTLSLEAALA